ncbi:MAG: hypothetical protein GY894_09195, partial [Planctomycetes bacterium]|nr:hypothetical protein [Planctomycetota bacterium]
GEIVEVTIAWHVLEEWYGNRAVDQWELDHYVELANEIWAPTGIQFAAHPVTDRIINPNWFEDIPNVDDFRTVRRLENALNIYWAAPESMGSLCGRSAFTFSPLDTIAISPECMGWWDVDGVFCHEVGHWFDLFHTHATYNGNECVERTNCLEAGDLLCDTPADFGLSFESCVDPYTCELLSHCADNPGPCQSDGVYTPDTENYMAYTAVPCMHEFTPDGIDRMRATAVNLRTAYLNTNLHHPCPSDTNWDYTTNVDDLLAIIEGYGQDCSGCNADVDGDGVIGVGDILSVIAAFGPCFECLSESDCDDGDPYTFDRCLFGECSYEPMRADCCIQGTCVTLIPPSVCESAGGVSVFENTACSWACGRGDTVATAQIADLGRNPFTNTYAMASDEPVDALMCKDTDLDWIDLVDVWMKFNPPADGTVIVSLCSEGSFDTSLVLYQGPEDPSPGELMQIACNGDAVDPIGCQPGYSEVSAPVIDGDGWLYIRVGSQSGAYGLGVVTVDFAE